MRRTVMLLPALVALLVLPSFLQTRQKKAAPPDFQGSVKKAVAAYEAKQYGLCIRQLGIAGRLVAEARRKVILAALPPAPEGFEIVPERKVSEQERAMMAGLAQTMVGHAMERKYRQKGGKGRIDVSIMADSPMVKMLAMQFSMAKMDPKLEAIGYNAHKGLLKKGSRGLELTILISGKHLLQVKTRGLGEDALFKMFSQAVVDKVAAQL